MSHVTAGWYATVVTKIIYLDLRKHLLYILLFSMLAYLILIKMTLCSFVSCTSTCAENTVLQFKGSLQS